MANTNFDGLSIGGVPVSGTSIPPITGTYYHVCPGSSTITNNQGKQVVGSSGNDGLSVNSPLDSIVTAYNKCVSGAGDGIILWGFGTSTAMNTSYLSSSLTWSKSGITVVGIASPSGTSMRSRVSNLSTVTTLANLITVSGSDNRFFNVAFFNSGSDATALGCIRVSGARNAFVNCHIASPGHATPAQTTGSYALDCYGASENAFIHCTIGLDTVDQDGSQAATGQIKFTGSSGGASADCTRNVFEDCTILSYWSYANAICGAIHHVGSGDSIARTQQFKRCSFINFKLGLPTTTPPANLVVGTAPNNGVILLDNCTVLGYAAYDAVTTNDRVYVTSPATNATGGLAVVTT